MRQDCGIADSDQVTVSSDEVGGSTVRPRFTCSALSSYSRCPRQYYWAYERVFKPVVYAAPIELGVGVHKVLEVLYRTSSEAAALEAAADYQSVRQMDWWRDLMSGYAETYRPEIEGGAGRLVEHEFAIALPRGVQFGGRLDLLLGDVLIDHKSTWRTTPDRWAGNRSWEQLYAYALALEHEGHQVTELVFNVVVADARTKNRFFRVRRPLDVRELKVMPIRLSNCALRVLDTEVFPANRGAKCKACGYAPLCDWKLEPDASDEAVTAAGFVRKSRRHEELSAQSLT